MRLPSAFVLPLVLLAACGRGTEAPNPNDFEFVTGSGMTVRMILHEGSGLFASNVFVGAGSTGEDDATAGSSHFLEHLLFNGTTAMTQEELYAAVDQIGAYNNATTRQEYTHFMMVAPGEELGAALGIQSSMLLHSTLPPEKFEKERGIVLEEINRDADSPASAREARLSALLEADDPNFLRPVLGTPTSIAALSRDEVLAYYEAQYTPANMKLLLMGDFDVAAARTLIEQLFSADRRNLAQPAPAATWPATSLHTVDATEDDRCTVAVQIPAPPVADPDYAAFSLIADALGGDSGRLRKALTERDTLSVQDIGVSIAHREGQSLLEVRVSCSRDTDTAQVLEVVLGELATVSHTGLRAVEWAQARNRALSTSIRQVEQLHYYALLQGDLIWHSRAGFEDRYQAALADSYAHMGAVAARWFTAPVLKVVVLDPKAEAALGPMDPVVMGYQPRADAETGRPLPGGGKLASTVPVATSIQPPTVTMLANGLTLIHSASPSTRMFAIHVLVRDRSQREPAQRPGMADLLHRCLPLGADHYDAEEFAALLDGIGAEWKVTDSGFIPYDDYYATDPRFSFLRLDCVDLYWKEAMRLVGLMLSDPSLTDDSIAQMREEVDQRRQQDAQSGPARARSAFAAELYGADSPLARPVFGREGSLDGVDHRELAAFALDYLDPGQVVISIVGNVDQQAVLAQARRTLSGGAASPRAAATPLQIPLTTVEQRQEIDGGGQQTSLRLGRSFELAPTDRWALEVATMIASERMQQDLRETRGWAYSLGISLAVEGDRAVLVATMGTRPELATEAESAVADWLASGELEVSASEVAAAVNSHLGRMRMRRVTSIGRAFNLGYDWFSEGSVDANAQRSAGMRAVTPDDVARVSALYFRAAPLIRVVVR